MNTKTRYALPVFAAVFALMFAAATPYVIAEPGQEKDWDKDTKDYPKKDIRQDMAEKLNAYCEMSPQEQAELIEKYNKTEEMVAKMNEYCSLDEAGKQAFIEEHKDQYRKHLGDKTKDDYKKQQHHMKVKVEGFTGLIQVPDMSDVEDKKAAHDALKEKITVKLSEAAAAAENAGLDVMKGSIGKVVNEDGVKSVAWILVAMDYMDTESEMMSKTIFVVDAADITNTAQTTKEVDHYQMMMSKQKEDKRYSSSYSHGTGYNNENTLSSPEQIQSKIERIEDKIAKGTGNTTMDALKAQFVDLLKQLQTAITNGDDAQADSLREQLQDLRNQMTVMKRHS